MLARFSNDYFRLCYFAPTIQFLSYSGYYEIKYLNWPCFNEKAVTVIEEIKEYPDDESNFCGLYGYNLIFTPCNFLGGSNRYYLVMSEFKGYYKDFFRRLREARKCEMNQFIRYGA